MTTPGPGARTILRLPEAASYSRASVARLIRVAAVAISIDAFTNHDESLRGGIPDRVRLAVDSIAIQGTAVHLPSPGVTAFVGGNNVGKSTLLRQLATWIGSEPKMPIPGPLLLDEVRLAKSGDNADLAAWLYAHRPTGVQGAHVGVLDPHSGLLPTTSALHYWTGQGYESRLAQLGATLVYYAGTQQRLEMSQPADRRSDFTESPRNALQRLEDDPSLLDELTRVAKDAFSQRLVMDPLSGQLILRVGTPEVDAPAIDAITPAYREALGRLQPLHEQGDGMRSMMGLLLPIVSSTYPVVVVDEPEAFLHPPQARILGKELALLAESRGIQIILATHDKNILTGLLDAPSAPVSVVRLTRQGDRTAASQIPAEQLRSVWADPSLRYSNILDGLFHRAVVLAENERDCRFFAAAVDAAHRRGALPIAPYDVLFVPTAGKTNIRPLAATMNACGVPTVASADLDLLNDERTLQALVEALGSDWSEFATDYRVATGQFTQPKGKRQNRDVLGAISTILDESPEGIYDGSTRARVQEALAVDNPWQDLKKHGMSAFRAERARADSLVQALDGVGVVLAKEGELEGFAPGLGVRKGPGWVPAAITAGAHDAGPAREHVVRLLNAAIVGESAMLDTAEGSAEH